MSEAWDHHLSQHMETAVAAELDTRMCPAMQTAPAQALGQAQC